MNETTYWKPKSGFDIKSFFSKFKLPTFKFNGFKFGKSSTTPSSSMSMKPKRDLKTLYKRLGVAGVITIAVLGVLVLSVFFLIVKPAYAVLGPINKLKADSNALGEAFKKQDLDGVKASLETLKVDFNDLRASRDANFGWAKGFSLTKDYYSDSEHFITAGLDGVDAISEFVNVVQPFADAAGFKSQANVEVTDPNAGSGLAEAVAGWVKVMPEVASKMDPVIEKVDKVGEELQQVDANRYPENIGGVAIKSNIEAAQQYLSKAKDYGPDIKAALTVIPSVLGVGAEKRYAIIMQNDYELRPTGGFWTNYATFRIKDAALNSDFTSKDMYSIDQIISTTDTIYTSPFLPPTPPYAQFLKVEHTYARDSNFSPDYVTSVDAWMKYYNKAHLIAPLEAKPINGVFAMDTHVIRELLKITGPVTVGGTTFDSDSAVLELEKIASLELREQQNRKKVLGDVMEAMLINMYKSERNLWPKFIETAIKLAIEKHAQGYVFDNADAQKLLEKYNFGGRIMPYDRGDYSFVVSTNLAGNKNNAFVTKSVVHNITQENGKVLHEVVINYVFGDPQPGYEPLVSQYAEWVRVYAPAGSKLVSVDGSDATTSADTGEELGKVYFAGHITLPPHESKTIKFKYEIPNTLITDKAYNLYLQKQAGTNNDKHTVNVKGKTQEAELITDKELNFKF